MQLLMFAEKVLLNRLTFHFTARNKFVFSSLDVLSGSSQQNHLLALAALIIRSRFSNDTVSYVPVGSVSNWA